MVACTDSTAVTILGKTLGGLGLYFVCFHLVCLPQTSCALTSEPGLCNFILFSTHFDSYKNSVIYVAVFL